MFHLDIPTKVIKGVFLKYSSFPWFRELHIDSPLQGYPNPTCLPIMSSGTIHLAPGYSGARCQHQAPDSGNFDPCVLPCKILLYIIGWEQGLVVNYSS